MKGEIQTSELGEAAILVYHGHTPLRHEFHGKRLVFFFADSAEARQLIGDFVAGALRVEPAKMLAAYREVRKILRQTKIEQKTFKV